VEVLIALVAISALVAGALGLVVKAGSVIRSARISTAAILIAAQKVEQLQAAPAAATVGTREDYVSADGMIATRETAAVARRWTVTAGSLAPGSPSVLVEVVMNGAGPVATLQAAIPPSSLSWGRGGQ